MGFVTQHLNYYTLLGDLLPKCALPKNCKRANGKEQDLISVSDEQSETASVRSAQKH